MNILFQPWEMGNLRIKNRIVRSATDETLSTDEGAPTQKLIDVLVDLARGGVGLIIAGTAYISREGRWGKNTTGMDNDRLIKPLRHLCEEVLKGRRHSSCSVVTLWLYNKSRNN